MDPKFSVITLFLYMINMSMILTLSILSTMISDIKDNSPLNSIYKPELRGLLYFVIVVLIGINIFSFFICNDLNEYALSRILTPYGYRTKLRVVS
ncbi:hypothetical protein NBO_4g0007 [Nosema bombycis CQ1]|uniref:Uncharacterized protein n=1 Tax=Nosema bombycis (strain CQ1 / CVCC 102059) TaxID=578461 RepID=R0MBS1_NOSB1|nr:hypothetical protein NBO_4g0007 [Nosema bombycis CQ1]|eukprot:EOB15379.1 hypothetical protein NBO_4g0007 [Nosema bombycis CQ1]